MKTTERERVKKELDQLFGGRIYPIELLNFILADRKAILDRITEPLRELYAMVKGECPSLLDEDSGGNARLDMEIEESLNLADEMTKG